MLRSPSFLKLRSSFKVVTGISGFCGVRSAPTTTTQFQMKGPFRFDCGFAALAWIFRT